MPFEYYFSRKQLHATPFSAKMGMILPRRMPSRLLVTGGCGFIGSNYIIENISNHQILNFDKQTYAGINDNLPDGEFEQLMKNVHCYKLILPFIIYK